MASIRDLKKDINFLVDHFISECYTQLSFSILLDQESIIDVITDALELRKSTITKLNANAAKGEEKYCKKHYKAIANDFFNQIIELTERLHSIKE